MNVIEAYDKLGGDYEDAINRLMKMSLLLKVLRMFPNDTSMADLHKAVEEKNVENAFRAAHTLKGVCLGLSLTRIAAAASTLTELLRGREWTDGWEEAYEKLSEEYINTISVLSELED